MQTGAAAGAGRAALVGDLSPGIPDLATIFSAHYQVLRHVPKAARGAWAQCLARRALGRVAAVNSDPPLLEGGEEVCAKLRAKHPQAPAARPALLPLGPPARGSVPDVSAEQVLAAVRSFRRGQCSRANWVARRPCVRSSRDCSLRRGHRARCHFARLAKGRRRPAAHCCGGNLEAPCSQVPFAGRCV